jgi:hypothetical protein
MIGRFLALMFLVLLATTVAGHARTVSVQLGKAGSVAITFPKAWDVSDIERGVEAKTTDAEVFVWGEAYTEDLLDTVLKEHDAYFTKQGVTVTGKIQSESKVINGLNMKMLNVPATWHGKPTVLQYLLVDPGWKSGWKLMLSEWASPEGDTKYQPDLDSILNSLSFSAQ